MKVGLHEEHRLETNILSHIKRKPAVLGVVWQGKTQTNLLNYEN